MTEQRMRVAWLVEELNSLPGLTAVIVQDEAGRAVYRVQVRIDEQVTRLSARDLTLYLEQGDPSIFTRNHYVNTGVHSVKFYPVVARLACSPGYLVCEGGGFFFQRYRIEQG